MMALTSTPDNILPQQNTTPYIEALSRKLRRLRCKPKDYINRLKWDIHETASIEHIQPMIEDIDFSFELDQSFFTWSKFPDMRRWAMQDYAEMVGGHCVISSVPGRGTSILATLPLEALYEEPPEKMIPLE